MRKETNLLRGSSAELLRGLVIHLHLGSPKHLPNGPRHRIQPGGLRRRLTGPARHRQPGELRPSLGRPTRLRNACLLATGSLFLTRGGGLSQRLDARLRCHRGRLVACKAFPLLWSMTVMFWPD